MICLYVAAKAAESRCAVRVDKAQRPVALESQLASGGLVALLAGDAHGAADP